MTRFEPVAWVLNLDAEEELAHPGAHTPSAAMTARIERLREHLTALLRPDDVLVWPGDRTAKGLEGRAWCPTRWALERLERAGARLPRVPSRTVLKDVNHRRFAANCGQFLPGAAWVETEQALEQVLDQRDVLARASSRETWLLKRPLGFAGRGRRKVTAGALTPEDRAWMRASLNADGLQVEPWVERELDVALHGWLTETGELTLGVLTTQDIDEAGAWVRTVVAPEGTLTKEEVASLTNVTQATARALHSAGYFGPFGVDAFRWRAADGEVHFQPRSEVNARYSMGWGIGMALGSR